jgi:pyruvate kinase
VESVRRTKIVATLGPKSWALAIIKLMILAGVDAFRINLSHAKSERDYEFFAKIIKSIRKIASNAGRDVKIIIDTPGHKFRFGEFVEREVVLGERLVLAWRDDPRNGDLPFHHKDYLAKMQKGQEIIVADGIPRFKVIKRIPAGVICEVSLAGLLEPRKGVTVRGFKIASLKLPHLTERDKRGSIFAKEVKAEQVVLSYGTSATQARAFKRYLASIGATCDPVFKYELEEAGKDLDGIVDESVVGYVGQGDLGLSITHSRVPAEGLKVIKAYSGVGKDCMVGTQLFDSMKRNPFPTHGESAGIYYWVEHRASALVLSDETSIGKYPVRAVEFLRDTILKAEAIFG